MEVEIGVGGLAVGLFEDIASFIKGNHFLEVVERVGKVIGV